MIFAHKDVHVLSGKPLPEWYGYGPRAQNETHWAGCIRLNTGQDVPCEAGDILAIIQTNGESTWEAMLASLSPERLAQLRAVHPSDDPIVNFSWVPPQ